MYIENRAIASFYKLILGSLLAISFWATLGIFGMTAWRLFATWVFLVGAIYYVSSALITMFSAREPGGTLCPMLQGAIITNLFLISLTTLVCHLNGISHFGFNGPIVALVYGVLPILALGDWLLFSKKGLYLATFPFDWLAPALIYASIVIFTNETSALTNNSFYPLAFFDFNTIGVPIALGVAVIFVILILSFGFVLYLADAACGGKISQRIVIPKIKTVEVVADKPAPKVNKKQGKASSLNRTRPASRQSRRRRQ